MYIKLFSLKGMYFPDVFFLKIGNLCASHVTHWRVQQQDISINGCYNKKTLCETRESPSKTSGKKDTAVYCLPILQPCFESYIIISLMLYKVIKN